MALWGNARTVEICWQIGKLSECFIYVFIVYFSSASVLSLGRLGISFVYSQLIQEQQQRTSKTRSSIAIRIDSPKAPVVAQ